MDEKSNFKLMQTLEAEEEQLGIQEVSKEVINNMVDEYCKGKPRKEDPLCLCKEGDKYVAIDDTSGDCWVEEFDTKLKAIRWLEGKED
jgi:hypothetical protein